MVFINDGILLASQYEYGYGVDEAWVGRRGKVTMYWYYLLLLSSCRADPASAAASWSRSRGQEVTNLTV